MKYPEHAGPGDLAACREMIRTGSRSFFAASLLLPEHARDGAYALYAFCRLSDDAVDLGDGGEGIVARLAERLDAIYAGAPGDAAVDRALADTISRYAFPRAPFDALLEGLAWDAEGRGCETICDLYDYAARVAGAVGVMMAVLMRSRTPDLLARASDLGVAMQLTNVARDVGEDARAGRLYLPRTWMREAGLDPDAWLARPEFNPGIATVVDRVLRCADDLYRRADAGIAGLPQAFRPAIRAARLLYAGIGAEVDKRGGNSVSGRAVVPASRKLQLVLTALTQSRSRASPGVLSTPALRQTQFLIDGIAQSGAEAQSEPIRNKRRDAIWVIDLFAALDERPRRLV